MTITRDHWVVSRDVRRQLDRVDSMLTRIGVAVGPASEIYAQLLDPRAKRLRPAFVLLAARFGEPDADTESLLRAACAVELVHEATLYHDDIVDEASERRGRPTVCHRFGPRVAASAGSELLYAGTELCADLPAPIKDAIARTAGNLSRSQYQEVATAGSLDVTALRRMRIMHGKTAALFRLSMLMGAVLAGVATPVTASLLRFAGRFGVCYQLADDLADLFADRSMLGRAPGSDLLDGIVTLPVLAGLAESCEPHSTLRHRFDMLTRTRDDALLDAELARLRSSPAVQALGRTLEVWLRATVSALPRPENQDSAAAVESLVGLCKELRTAWCRDDAGGEPVEPHTRGAAVRASGEACP